MNNLDNSSFMERVAAYNRRRESNLRRSLYAESKANAGEPSPHFTVKLARPGRLDDKTRERVARKLAHFGAQTEQVT